MDTLRKDTATHVLVGPFLDKNDGVTAKTALTFADISSALVVKGVTPTTLSLTTSGGTNDFIHVADGYYDLELAASNVDTAGIMRVALRNDTIFLPVWNHFEVIPQQVYDSLVAGTDLLDVNAATLGDSSTVITSLINNIGNLDAPISSVINYLLGIMGGAGFQIGSHSLIAIVNLINSLVGVSSGGGSGSVDFSTDSSLLARGFIARLIALVRKFVDDPAINPKWSNADILALCRKSWQQLWIDLNLSADNPITVRMDIEMTADVQEYAIPPTVGEILRLSAIEPVSDLARWEVVPKSRYNPYGPGFMIEGNLIRLTPKWVFGDVMRFEYIPSGDVCPHEGTGSAVPPDDDHVEGQWFTLSLIPTAGVLDERQNAYGGYLIRFFTDDGIQECIIEQHDQPNNRVKLRIPTNPVLPAATAIAYEVVPVFGFMFEFAIATLIARSIFACDANAERRKDFTSEYAETIRGLQLHLAHMQNRRCDRAQGDHIDNRRYGRRSRMIGTGGLNNA